MSSKEFNIRSPISISCKTALGILGLAFFFSAHAALQDEIQVYTDEINEPGEYGLELHVNGTPKGNTTPAYPGELPSHHSLRLTPEFSLGLTRTTEIGLYVPTVRAADGAFYGAGLKLRLKWLPVQADEDGGFFAGMNFELGQVGQRFSESPRGAEIRNILGWRNAQWLAVVNPILGVDVSRGYSHAPMLELATKINRKVGESTAIGWERYSEMGPLRQMFPGAQQSRVNYLVVDHEGATLDYSVGVGKGNLLADKWTIKAIIGYSFGKRS